ncbi:MAG: GNAT family N-acetyltransferase [Cyclobacteriaceae bacterium]
MEIRQAEERDIPAIVELLKLSLGESLMPKSEAFWRWKHLDNPFGKSPVLLAFVSKQLVGVRAFMRWEWRQGERIYKAVRAVDTATHPQFQGRGIFRKLTLELVHQCRQEGIDFIFNTPNKKSKPGYLSMGWIELGRLAVNVRPILRFSKKVSAGFQENFKWQSETLDKITIRSSSQAIITHYKAGFFQWRYGANPNAQYYLAGDESAGLFLIFRLKQHRFGNEFRVVDSVTTEGNSRYTHCELLRQAVNQSGARLVTMAGDYSIPTFLSMKVGPTVTTKSLNLNKTLSFSFWKPSLGDMEIF